jgi:hypothetical protein
MLAAISPVSAQPVRYGTRPPPGAAAAAPAQGGLVRDAEVEHEAPAHAADQALRRAQGEREGQPQHQHQLDGAIRRAGLATWCRSPGRLPAGERRLLQPLMILREESPGSVYYQTEDETNL